MPPYTNAFVRPCACSLIGGKNVSWVPVKMFPELKTLEWDILNPDRIINLEIKNERRTSNI